MAHKCPYTYPHRSRKAQAAYLAEHDSYGGWNHPMRRWSPLSWNVRIGNVNWRRPKGDCDLDAAFDDDWESYVESNQELFAWITEDMAREYTDSEYTTYPGEDQGDWTFCFAGRSGGQMLLAKWLYVDFIRGDWSESSWAEWLDDQPADTIRTLYRAVRCMDQDFTSAKIDAEFEYRLNDRRGQWEAERLLEQASY